MKNKNLMLLWIFLHLTLGSDLFAETHIQVFHTSDIHGHFSNSDSPLKLGGLARLKYKLDQLKQKNKNYLFLDSGDWTEGTIFYALNSGEANHRLMEFLGYDAIVLGNHEWLVGPEELYTGLAAAQFQIPILGANIRFDKVPETLPLGDYIKPYFIKTIDGVKVGVLGLSTFELIYDPFFEPAQMIDPVRVATKYVKILKEKEQCDVVILLTHTGLGTDKKLAQSVPGVDLIVGGHSHILTQQPVVVNKVPIVHIGFWAQYLGEYELLYKDGKTELISHKIHQIDESLPEDFETKTLIKGYEKKVIEKFGNIFEDRIVKSDVHLPLRKSLAEDILGNWAVDAIKAAGHTEVGLDVGQYYRRNLFSGYSSTVDFFNLFPHVYSTHKQKSWTIYNFEMKGSTVSNLLNVFAKLNLGVKISGGSYRINANETLFPVQNFYIGNSRIENSKYYKISATQGILTGLDYLKILGVNIGVRKIKDTGIEAWRVIKDAVQAKSPITVEKTKWQGRVRTLQPDFHIPVEQIHFTRKNSKVWVHFQVMNAGVEKLKIPAFYLKIDITPQNSLDNQFLKINFSQLENKILQGGKGMDLTSELNIQGWASGVYPLDIESLPVEKEIELENNSASSFFSI